MKKSRFLKRWLESLASIAMFGVVLTIVFGLIAIFSSGIVWLKVVTAIALFLGLTALNAWLDL